jgi:hypothetical protein
MPPPEKPSPGVAAGAQRQALRSGQNEIAGGHSRYDESAQARRAARAQPSTTILRSFDPNVVNVLHPRKERSAAQEAATFTGRKLDWMKASSLDRRVGSFDYRLGTVIASHVNQHTGRTPPLDVASRAAARLEGESVVARAVGCGPWDGLTWQRTQTANVYMLHFEHVAAMLDMLVARREARRERRRLDLESSDRTTGVLPGPFG